MSYEEEVQYYKILILIIWIITVLVFFILVMMNIYLFPDMPMLILVPIVLMFGLLLSAREYYSMLNIPVPIVTPTMTMTMTKAPTTTTTTQKVTNDTKSPTTKASSDIVAYNYYK